MTQKNIQFVLAPPAAHWVGDGFRVHNFVPSQPGLSMQQADPFILLDYNALMDVPAGHTPKGVGVHPHRGFETVTIAYKGRVEHHDSSGGGGVIGEGDVQWMTAASGVLHKEHHEQAFAKEGGPFQMVQLWVNLPAKDKMSAPKYQAITNAQMGRYALPKGGYVEVIAGEYKGVQGPATTHTPMAMLNARLRAGETTDFAFPAHHNTLVLAIEGSARLNGTDLPQNHLAKLDNVGETFTLEATEDAVILILSGEPIGEPIAAYGPFVMNTKEEIRQAFADFEAGKFGELAD